jgi:hypothetical protein
MKKYFLHNGTESSGPFDLEELKSKRITKNSPVWFEGMENWKTAGEIPELRTIFTIIPPPIPSFSTAISKPRIEKKEEEEVKEEVKILGLSKNTFFIILGSVLFLLIITILNAIEDKRSQELEIQNHKTEIENHQYEIRQKEIIDQKNIETEQEKAEAERIKKERKQTITNRILEINNLLEFNSNTIEAAQKKLEDTSSFKFLRTADEKKEQISLLQKEISDYKTENDKLENESDELKLELEKIKLSL